MEKRYFRFIEHIIDMHSPLETKFYKFRAYLMIGWVFLSDEYEIDIYKSFSE